MIFPKRPLIRAGLGFAACGLLVATGCKQRPQDPPSVGSSSFTFLEQQTAPVAAKNITLKEGKAARPMDDFREAVPIYPLVNPAYPMRALTKKAGLATVGVRVTVDASGRVTEVAPSMRLFSTPGPFAEDFLAAVRAAVLQWRFRPAAIERIEWVQASGLDPYSRVLSAEKTETHFDLSFSFTASGKVLGGEEGK